MRVAVVDQSAAVREAVATLLRGRADVVEASSLAELRNLQEPLDVIVVEFAGCTGAFREHLCELRERWPQVRVVVASPGDEGEYAVVAERLAAHWIPKPRLGLALLQLLERLDPPVATAR